jgi:TPR repeat protein
MSGAPDSSDHPKIGARTVRLGQVWEAANKLAAAQVPKQLSGSTRRATISAGSTNSLGNDSPSSSSLHDRFVHPDAPPPSHLRSRSKLVIICCLVAVILAIAISLVIVFGELPLADIWHQPVNNHSWTRLNQATSAMRGEQAIPRLIVQSSRGMAGEPVPLGLAIQRPAEGVVVLITGMLAGMEVSTGFEVGAHKWELLPEDVGYAFVVPPENFVGSVDLVVELRLADDKIVDRQAIYLEWVPPTSPGLAENQHNREEAAETNPPVLASKPDLEKAEAPSSTSLAPKTLDQPEVTVSSSPPVLASERDLAKALAAIRSSSSLAPEPPDRQKAAVSSDPPIASDRELQKSATAPSSRSFEQSHADQKVSTALPRIAQKQVDREEAAAGVRTPIFAQRQVDQEEIAVLLKRGKDLLANGDVSAARIILKRAADANDVEAALALASTYDPFVLRELKVYGFPADAATARGWYEKAKELGSAVAPRRLEILASGAR